MRWQDKSGLLKAIQPWIHTTTGDRNMEDIYGIPRQGREGCFEGTAKESTQ